LDILYSKQVAIELHTTIYNYIQPPFEQNTGTEKKLVATYKQNAVNITENTEKVTDQQAVENRGRPLKRLLDM
jgi:hypothetical protein